MLLVGFDKRGMGVDKFNYPFIIINKTLQKCRDVLKYSPIGVRYCGGLRQIGYYNRASYSRADFREQE